MRTIPSQHPFTARKLSLVFTLNGTHSHLGLEGTRLTSSEHSLIAISTSVLRPLYCNLPLMILIVTQWLSPGVITYNMKDVVTRNRNKPMALYPRQNSNSCLQHCCFELLLVFTFQYSTSTIQHCPFIIQCAYFKCNVVTV